MLCFHSGYRHFPYLKDLLSRLISGETLQSSHSGYGPLTSFNSSLIPSISRNFVYNIMYALQSMALIVVFTWAIVNIYSQQVFLLIFDSCGDSSKFYYNLSLLLIYLRPSNLHQCLIQTISSILDAFWSLISRGTHTYWTTSYTWLTCSTHIVFSPLTGFICTFLIFTC